MSAPVLRDYQFSSVQRIRTAYASGRRRVLFQLPTGAGKTICFAYVLASAAKRGSRVLVLAHRVEILEQIEAALELAGVKYGIIAPGHPETDDAVQIASIAALAHVHRLRRWRDRFDFIVVDECHHAVAGSWARVLASQPRAAILGVTATPERLDGKGLGEIFDDMVVGPSTAELIKAEWLSPFVAFEPVKAPDLNGAKIRAGDFAIEDIRDAMGGVVIGAQSTNTRASALAFLRSPSVSIVRTLRRSLSASAPVGVGLRTLTERHLPTTAGTRLRASATAASTFCATAD